MEYPNYYDDVNRLHNIYNSLGDVYEASEIVSSRPNLLPALASLLARYGLARNYDIRLNHKHFNIYEGEMVISFMGRDSTLSVVCNDDELPEEMLANEGVIPVPGHIVVPSEFLVKDGQAIPYEFAYAAPEREENIDPTFLYEWCNILRHQGVDGLLGLSLRDDRIPMNALEVSNPQTRINRLIFGNAGTENIPAVSTAWRVHEVYGVVEAKKCRSCRRMQEHIDKCSQG